MDLGLLQRKVAEIIGVTESSVWEHGVEPEKHYNPNIIKFLGSIPFDCPEGTASRYRIKNKEQNAGLMGLE